MVEMCDKHPYLTVYECWECAIESLRAQLAEKDREIEALREIIKTFKESDNNSI